MKNHSCHVYFRITGIFDPQFVACILGKTPHNIMRRGDVLPISKIVVDEDQLDICYYDKYNVDLNEMMRAAFKDLMEDTELLNKVKKVLGLKYYVVVVPRIDMDSDEPTPVLSLDNDIIDFMSSIGAIHDLDYYIY